MNEILPDFVDALDASRPPPRAEAMTGCEATAAAERRSRYPGAFSSGEPTPFEQSGMRDQFEPSGLHNAREPYYAIQHEKGFHRLVAMMHVRGDTNREIAKELGRSEVNISNILRQPYVQQYIVEEAKRLGGQEVMTVLRGAALKAARRILVEVDNVDTGTAQSRSAAANSVLDRVFGKAPVTVTHFDGGEVDQLSDEEIARRLKELETQKTN